MDKETLKRRLLGEFSWKRLVRSLIFIYVFFAVYVYFMADRMIFLPRPSSYPDTPDILKVTTADDLQISAVYLPNPTATYTSLYIHGNAEDLGEIQPLLHHLHSLGFSVFAYDYRGYGTSQGSPSEQNAYRDSDTAFTYLKEQLGVPPKQIIAYGRSVGGGSAVDLAARHPLAGLILESSFTSAFRVVLPIPILPFDKFPNLDKITQVNCPVLVIHGTADQTIPLSHGQRLFAAAPKPKHFFWVEGAGHNDLFWVAGEQYGEALHGFAQLVAKTQLPDAEPRTNDQ
ncbi:MAG: alpha/beta hydrolase [Coleofasciculus sp. D1-CHI-01]|uniref:alpha/beta hydrolase n=1 Tax=Coleofasciculus sp. D1-CHI-01 TaxID=3068482 RepID=UPI0032F4537A